jgi:hypothetical protein
MLVVGGAWTLLTHTWPSIETGGCIPLVRSICVAGGAILCFDGAMQLGSVFDPKNSLFSFAYPTPRTGFFPLFQVSGYAADCPYALAASVTPAGSH